MNAIGSRKQLLEDKICELETTLSAAEGSAATRV